MTIATRPARVQDLEVCAQVLAEAFRDDPLMTSIWPDSRERYRALPGYFTASLTHFHLGGGGVQVATTDEGRIGAVAVWDLPEHWNLGVGRILRAVPSLLAPMRTRALAAIRVLRTLDTYHPHEPEHWYLANLAVSDEFRKQGFAAQLLNTRLAQCDTEGVGAYLVATHKDNVGYYEKVGFAVTNTFTLPGNNAMWSMWRQPIPSA